MSATDTPCPDLSPDPDRRAVTAALMELDYCGLIRLIRLVAVGAQGATYVLGCDLDTGAADDGGADE